MKPMKRYLVTAAALAALTASVWAQTDTASKSADAANNEQAQGGTHGQPAATTSDIQALKEGLAAALQQIQTLKDELHRRDQAVAQAQATATEAAAKADAAQSDVADLKTVSATSSTTPVLKNAVMSLQEPAPSSNPAPEQVFNTQMESPITIRFRGINITPGGYSEGAFVHRSRALGADLPTPFNSLTMPGASQSQLPEFFGSGRQSKVTAFVEGHAGSVDLSSYVSADFLSAGVTSTSTQTDGYTLRLRQAWGQVKFDNGFSFLAGQAWSLVTEDAKGIAPDDDMGKTNDVRPKTIDPSYNVGFDFARQFGLRVTKSFGDKVAVAFAIENPQATVSTHNNANNYLFLQAGASNSYNTTGTYGFNPAPDIIAKIAFDPGFGHYEVFGIADRFTDRVFPCEDVAATALCGGSTTAGPNALGAYNASKEGGGFGASGRWTVAKRVTFGLKGFGGSGVGRYAPGGLVDASINPDGTVHLIKNLHGLGTLEWHGKKLDVYTYGGTEYAGRSYGYDPTILSGTTPVGYVGYGAPEFNNSGCYTETAPAAGPVAGSLKNCTGDTRALIEGTLGFWYRFYSGPRGRFQFGSQYSYVTRNTWSGNDNNTTAARSPNGVDNMIFASFRYYLP
ncbi:MAG: hypothetical protein WBS24_15495 [Terriglobales bacterium]